MAKLQATALPLFPELPLPTPSGIARTTGPTAPPPGFEPGPSEPKSEVLPLHYGGSQGRPGSLANNAVLMVAGPHPQVTAGRPHQSEVPNRTNTTRSCVTPGEQRPQ